MDYVTPEQIEQMKKIEALKKAVIGKILSKQAIERLGRIRLVKPELAEQLELYLVQLYQSGQIKSIIQDAQLKEILDSITSKKQFRIKR